jgi:spermidine/putrescine transport system permease protein
MAQRRSIGLTLILPAAVWLLLFFIVPMIGMAIFSFRPDMSGDLFSLGWAPTLKQYETATGNYSGILWVSVQIAFGVALITTILAYPLAYFLVFKAGDRAPLLLTLAILPFWTSYLLRIIAWKIILGSDGLINSTLMALGLIHEASPVLLYSRTSVIITLIYVWLPFVALPIYAALQRINRSLLEAAAINGAPPWLAFLRVTLPLSLPGVIAGFVMVFIPTVGEYVTPVLVGGSQGSMYGNIIQTFFGQGINWPLGSALSMIMLAGVLLTAVILLRVVDVKSMME